MFRLNIFDFLSKIFFLTEMKNWAAFRRQNRNGKKNLGYVQAQFLWFVVKDPLTEMKNWAAFRRQNRNGKKNLDYVQAQFLWFVVKVLKQKWKIEQPSGVKTEMTKISQAMCLTLWFVVKVLVSTKKSSMYL